jgi:predicted transcriptional regulator
MTNQIMSINENLVKIDNLLNALELLYEEISTRKQEIIDSFSIKDFVKEEMNTDNFKNEVVYHIRYNYGSGICNEVSRIVMRNIDSDIERRINDRVDRALKQAGVKGLN